jgi:hypothetical protein
MPRAVKTAVENLLEILTHKVRVMTQGQAEALVSRSTLRRLVNAQFVAAVPTLIYDPLLQLEAPLATWSPGDLRVDAGATSYKARHRWKGLGAKVTKLLVATEAAAHRTGGIGRGRVVQGALAATHDCHVAQVYFRLPEEQRERWIPEDLLRSYGWFRETGAGKLPDAIVTDPPTAHDFIGAYPPSRVRELLAFAYSEGVSIELW